MGCFTKSSLPAYFLRNREGTLIAKVPPETFNNIMNDSGEDWIMSANKKYFTYNGNGFTVGHSEVCKIFVLDGTTIEAQPTGVMVV